MTTRTNKQPKLLTLDDVAQFAAQLPGSTLSAQDVVDAFKRLNGTNTRYVDCMHNPTIGDRFLATIVDDYQLIQPLTLVGDLKRLNTQEVSNSFRELISSKTIPDENYQHLSPEQKWKVWEHYVATELTGALFTFPFRRSLLPNMEVIAAGADTEYNVGGDTWRNDIFCNSVPRSSTRGCSILRRDGNIIDFVGYDKWAEHVEYWHSAMSSGSNVYRGDFEGRCIVSSIENNPFSVGHKGANQKKRKGSQNDYEELKVSSHGKRLLEILLKDTTRDIIVPDWSITRADYTRNLKQPEFKVLYEQAFRQYFNTRSNTLGQEDTFLGVCTPDEKDRTFRTNSRTALYVEAGPQCTIAISPYLYQVLFRMRATLGEGFVEETFKGVLYDSLVLKDIGRTPVIMYMFSGDTHNGTITSRSDLRT